MIETVSRFYGSSYVVRALIVLVILASISLRDFLRHRAGATRWGEHAFWIVCAGLGALFGIANDAVTSKISRAYFVLGKGLADDPGRFSSAVASLGARAGSFAGIVVGGVFLLANNPSRGLPQLRYRELAGFLVVPVLAALGAASLLAAFSDWDVQGLAPTLREVLSEQDVRRFLLVHRAHAGLYIGAIVATGVSAFWIRLRRNALRATQGTWASGCL